MNKNQIKAYKKLLKVAEKLKEVINDYAFISDIEGRLLKVELEDRFGIPLYSGRSDFFSVKNVYDNWTNLNKFIEGKSISWSDDDRQPELNEWLFVISFPTGPYIFSGDYPEETFKAFFLELKSFGPKYSDTVNKTLYFTEETSKTVYTAFWSIFNKYKAQVQDEIKQKRKIELEEELAKLNAK